MSWGSRAFACIVAAYTTAVGVVLAVEIGNRGFTISDIYFVPVVAGTAIGVFLTFKRPSNRMGLLLTLMRFSYVKRPWCGWLVGVVCLGSWCGRRCR